MSYAIRGGKKLSGSIDVNTAKNAATALLCASLMIKGKTTLYDMPRMEDVERILDILESIGVHFEWQNKTTLLIDTSSELRLKDIDVENCGRLRSSLLLLGALAGRVKKYKLYQSGGCNLGTRTTHPHVLALEKLGVHVTGSKDYFEVTNKKLKGAEIVMYESGDTPTENAIMAAVLAEGTTTIRFASANYMVQDLCNFLVEAGAKIEGIGTTTLHIKGVKKLKQVDRYHVMPDPLEAMAFISLAITTGSELLIKNCPLDFLDLELEKLKVMGQKIKMSRVKKSKSKHFRVADITVIPSPLVALPDKIHGMPYPGINLDNVPFFIPICTKAKGQSLIHDWAFESRPMYALGFNEMGANVEVKDVHRIFVNGPTKLKAANIEGPNAIRPGMMLLIGLIAAKGNSTISNTYPIERGYQNIVARLQRIGVDIKNIEE